VSRSLITPVRVWFAVTVTLLILVACGSPAAPTATPTAAPATLSAAPAIPAAPLDAAATPAPAAESSALAPAAGETRTFAIDPAQSEASYFVEEEFFGRAVPFVTAIGRTTAIEGAIELQVGDGIVTVGGNEFSVDLRTLTSDQSRRDNAIRDRWLESNRYPFAVFRANQVAALPAAAALGTPVAFQLVGDMTIREVTRPLTWDVTATLDGSTLRGTAQSFLLMRDYGFEPPDIAGMLRVTDGVTLTVNFVAEEAE
jgi:polyisoprenoid-binding protein YceI